MSALEPYLGVAKAVALVAVGLGIFWAGHRIGAQGVQAAWDADKAERARAEQLAIFQRLKANERLAEQQVIDNQRITKAHEDELAKVRADIARDHATGLRVGPALCAGFAGAAKTESAGGGDGADTARRVVRADIDRDLAAMTLRVEQALAAGRACQAFVAANGLAQ